MKYPSLITIKKNLSNDFMIGLVVISLWHFALIFIGVAIAQIVLKKHGLATGISDFGLLTHTARWDSGWLMGITHDFYRQNAASAAFYPLFPTTVVAVHTLSRGALSLLTSGFVVNFIASWLALVSIYKISLLLLKDITVSVFVSLSFLAFPSAFFLHSFYSEAVFCALGFWAYYFALRRNWFYSSILLAFLTASRITSILFVILCGLEYLRSKKWRVKNIRTDILWFSIAPTGFLAYATYLKIVRHDFLGMFHAYHAVSDWSYQVFNLNILYPYLKSGLQTVFILFHLTTIDNGSLVNVVFPFIALTILLITSIYGIFWVKEWAIPLGIFGILSFIMFNLNSNIVSAHRYVLPCLGLYLIGGSVLVKSMKPTKYAYGVMLAASLMAQVLLYILFTAGYFAG